MATITPPTSRTAMSILVCRFARSQPVESSQGNPASSRPGARDVHEQGQPHEDRALIHDRDDDGWRRGSGSTLGNWPVETHLDRGRMNVITPAAKQERPERAKRQPAGRGRGLAIITLEAGALDWDWSGIGESFSVPAGACGGGRRGGGLPRASAVRGRRPAGHSEGLRHLVAEGPGCAEYRD